MGVMKKKVLIDYDSRHGPCSSIAKIILTLEFPVWIIKCANQRKWNLFCHDYLFMNTACYLSP